MLNALLQGLLKIITTLLEVLLYPINSLFANIFPDLSAYVTRFYGFCTHYVTDFILYFVNLLPPYTKGLLIAWFTFVVAYYTTYYTYLAAVKIFYIIQKIKFW